jgi:hypothetical protein
MHPAKPHRVLHLTWPRLLVVALCQFLAAAVLTAQISNASINGTVRGATGAVVPEAVILLRNTTTGVESRTVTNDQGVYIILNILPENYNTTTKSGTNELHGNIYDVEQNDASNARNTFLASVVPFKGHTFGCTAGGPITIPKLKDGNNKTLFFGGYLRYYSVGPNFESMRFRLFAGARSGSNPRIKCNQTV